MFWIGFFMSIMVEFGYVENDVYLERLVVICVSNK